MRLPEIRLPQMSVETLTTLKVPSVSKDRIRELAPRIAVGAPVAMALIVGLMSVSSSLHAKFNWVPVSNGNIVIDSALKLILGLVLMAVAVLVTLPLSMAFHMIGHAVAGHFMGMRLLALRLGPILITPWSISDRFALLPIHSHVDLLTGWVQFDDSPLSTWKRTRAWQVMTGGGSAMNLGVSFLFALMSVLAGGITYVLFRQAVWLNLMVCLVNLIPFIWAKYEYETDGKRLLSLLFDEGDGADALIERLRNEVVVGPTRPASWPREREAAWETKLRQMPSTAEGRADQLETMIYLFLQGVDRGDQEVAWRWVQAMHHVIGADPDNHDVAAETARVMCALYAARWEKNAESAATLLEHVSAESGMRFSPWYTVAKAATNFAEVFVPTLPAGEKLTAAKETAILARKQLSDPAQLHGVDQLMLGIAQAIEGDADIEMQKKAYYETAQPAAPSTPEAAVQTAA